MEEGGGLCRNVLFLWVSDFSLTRYLVGLVCQTWWRMVPSELSLYFLKQDVLKMLFWQGQFDSAEGSVTPLYFLFSFNILTWLSWNHLPSVFETHLFLIYWSHSLLRILLYTETAAIRVRGEPLEILKVGDREFPLPSFFGHEVSETRILGVSTVSF